MLTWALATGKSVDEIHRMMEIMVRTNPDFGPSADDINSLITVANEKGDPYMAERLVALGERWGCKPNEVTHLLQMDYRLSIGDVEGARSAFDSVKSFRDGLVDAGPQVNKLIQAMFDRRKVGIDFPEVSYLDSGKVERDCQREIGFRQN